MATPIPPNRAHFTLGELAAATGGRLFAADPETAVTGVTTDSRTAEAGGLFVALWVPPGGPLEMSRDGHEFVAAARERGAFPLVAARRGVTGPRLEVVDTLRALGDLARHFVARQTQGHPVPALAIGGAAGKTTTKTLAAAAVTALCGPTLATPGSLNNLLGVPLTLLCLGREHRTMVIECGTSSPGEIPRLGEIVRPEVALVLNVDLEHSERLGDLAAIADEEAALFAAARRAVVTSTEEPELLARLPRSGGQEALLFGAGAPADVRLARRETLPDGTARVVLEIAARLRARRADRRLEIVTPLLGPTAAVDLAAAVAGTAALRDRPLDQEELVAVARALGAVPAVPGRLAPRRFGEVLVLDDTYNANPRSVRAALAAAREAAAARNGRLLVALGDMLELGDAAATAHAEIVQEAAAGAALFAGAGPLTTAAARAAGLATDCLLADDAAELAEALVARSAPGDVVLVKGSRGMRMERLVAAFERAGEDPG
ncbi:MAG TPA: Mur ligase family protein [Thermoanaerobaculia bacterium]|nr:Mur ligase family protein [Acidobacteriota bacterium]HRR14273.1 Mur ligase family protein [Thermoanaerobaculia bacterium]HRS37147.1 Mur ligase family protein [Thermoanaerobaculia bacterium]